MKALEQWARIAMASNEPANNQQSSGDQSAIALSFSGGGFRAAAYSLGSMALLQDLGLLSRAKVLSGVSGGSIAIGTYLCSKAGSGAETEEHFDFYGGFYLPLIQYLDQEELAQAFVSLPKILQGKKILHNAADNINTFLEERLTAKGKKKSQALFANKAIAGMLENTGLSPDYVFFNTTNITTLDLFRFGIQRTRGAETNPTFFLNRYFVKPSGHEASQKIYKQAGEIRIADCIASSFAFPGGFEPMIFPNDFFRSSNRSSWSNESTGSAMNQPWITARSTFELTPICDYKPYVAFLDGGLYDNLGLASVEDIRGLINRQHEEETSGTSDPATNSNTIGPRIGYVIATDVDNIQPANACYRDPDLEAELSRKAAAPITPEGQRCFCLPPRRAWLWIGLGAGALLSAPILAKFRNTLTIPPLPTGIGWGLLLGLLIVAATLLVLTSGLLAWARHKARNWNGSHTPRPSLAQMLGLSNYFQDCNDAIDPWSSLTNLALGLIFNHDRNRKLSALSSAIIGRRLNQLGPAFSGYLKRTRTLTYAYLEQRYTPTKEEVGKPSAQGAKQSTPSPDLRSCGLIRNMIFELSPGPDVDPDTDASEITIKAMDYADLGDQHAHGPNWAISRKLRRATNLARWISKENSEKPVQADGKHAEDVWTQYNLKRDLLNPNVNTAPPWPYDLNLHGAAAIWLWLHQQLGFDHDQNQEPGANQTKPKPSSTEICELVEQVTQGLKAALAKASKSQPGLEQRLRERGWVALSKDRGDSSWIPMLCEMATNLPTTLWTAGFRWYVFSAPDHDGDRVAGGWYSYQPDATILEGREWLDFGPNLKMANRITALSGYLCMNFNLLEFAYTNLASEPKSAVQDSDEPSTISQTS